MIQTKLNAEGQGLPLLVLIVVFRAVWLPRCFMFQNLHACYLQLSIKCFCSNFTYTETVLDYFKPTPLLCIKGDIFKQLFFYIGAYVKKLNMNEVSTKLKIKTLPFLEEMHIF